MLLASPARRCREADGPRLQGNAVGPLTSNGLAYPGGVPLSLRLIAGSVLVLAGVALLVVAALGARSRLPRNRWVGVRTASSTRSDAAFALAQRVAAVPVGAAGAVAVAGGAVLLALGIPAGATPALGWVVLAVSGAGALVLAGVGGMAGDRAAAAMPAPAVQAACAGTCVGCDLVAGCRPSAAPAEQ